MRVLPLSSDLSVLNLSQAVFVYPTDTCYGIGCSALSEETLKRVYEAKGRDFAKPVNIMVESMEMMERYGVLSETAKRLATTFLPGALTLLVPRTEALPSFVNPSQEFIGLRIPNHPFCLSLVKAIGAPVVTTSANVAGQPETYSVEDIEAAFDPSSPIDYVFDGGILAKNPPSTIVKVVGDAWEIVRQGSVTAAEITSCANPSK